MKMNKKGFTLAELLIVIAIIAILIAIAIPVFSSQLENAKVQADHANLRSAYAIVQTINLNGGKDGAGNSISAGATYKTDGTFGTGTEVKLQADHTTAKTGCDVCPVTHNSMKAGAVISVQGEAPSMTIVNTETGKTV